MRRPARRSAVLGVTLVTFALLSAPAEAEAQERRLGSIDFPNSGSADAQAAFIEGVLLLHSFEYEDAAAAFRRAQATDPAFALAYWGEAMTYNHPLWRQQDRTSARAALRRFQGPSPTEREGMYMAAVETLYGEGTKSERDQRYMEAMRRLHEAFPDDREAQAFYALSILGSRDGTRDFATYMRAAATAEPVFRANPEHPGAAHYLIHSFDDPIHAPLGLPAARAYGAVVPDAGHAQHMTSHIFVALGMWDEVVRANVNATTVQDRGRAAKGEPPNYCGHYSSWLQYGYLMKGRVEDAARSMDLCHGALRSPDPDDRGYFAGMRARYVIDTRDWASAGRWPADLSEAPRAQRSYDFTTAFAAIRQGELAAGRAGLAALRSQHLAAPRARIQEMELEALLALADGRTERGLELLREAAATEEGLPFEFGPPASLKPPHELWGEVLLEAGRPVEAVTAFRAALELTPLRRLSLEGLATAAERAGERGLAADARGTLALMGR